MRTILAAALLALPLAAASAAPAHHPVIGKKLNDAVIVRHPVTGKRVVVVRHHPVMGRKVMRKMRR